MKYWVELAGISNLLKTGKGGDDSDWQERGSRQKLQTEVTRRRMPLRELQGRPTLGEIGRDLIATDLEHACERMLVLDRHSDFRLGRGKPWNTSQTLK